MSMSLLTNALHTLRRKIDGPLGRRLPLRTLLSGILLFLSLRLILVKRRTTGRRSKYVSNLESVGKKVVDGKALNLEDAPEYDIVIIGGGKFVQCRLTLAFLCSLTVWLGTAGCVLAARLSENPNIRVLLLEAGGRYTIYIWFVTVFVLIQWLVIKWAGKPMRPNATWFL